MAKKGGKRDGAGRPVRSEIEKIRTRAWITVVVDKLKKEFERTRIYRRPTQDYMAECLNVTVRTFQRYMKNETSPMFPAVCNNLYKNGPHGLEIWGALEHGIYDEDKGCELLGNAPTHAMLAWHKLGCYIADHFTVARTHLTYEGEKNVAAYAPENAGIERLADIPGQAIVSILNELKELGELDRLGLEIDELALEIGVFGLLHGLEY